MNGLGIYANAATALLVGTGSNSDSFHGAMSPGSFRINESLSNSMTVIAPEFDAKLGVNYTHMMAQGNLTLDAGWMWTDYLSVLGSAGFDSGQRVALGLQGLYFELKWLGNLA